LTSKTTVKIKKIV